MKNDNYSKFEDEGEKFLKIDLANKNIRLKTPESKKEIKLGKISAPEEAKDASTRNYLISSSKEESSNSVIKKVNERLRFIGKYFDVEQDDIKEKLLYSVIPFNTNFQRLAEKNPDLYGPFWIYSTIVFIVAVAGNLSNYISVLVHLLKHPDKTVFRYDFNFVPASAGYVSIVVK